VYADGGAGGPTDSGDDETIVRPAEQALDRAKRLLRQAVADQAEPFQRGEVIEWFEAHAPDIGRMVVEGLLTAATVNDPHRRHFPAQEDLVFVDRDGGLWRYDPERHGRWTSVGLPRSGPLAGLQTIALAALPGF
jgi:hypothetical protein